jgi:3-oxoacyl-(acyl-carrier-protein) synthase
MGMALKGIDKKSIDAIVMHAPGTIQGDQSEFEAIKAIFETDMPLLTSNKWQLGHTFGASGLFSLELALLMLQNQQFIDNPFYTNKKTVKALKRILVNSVGFGGNAVSVLVEV